jgi:hypothetical protein
VRDFIGFKRVGTIIRAELSARYARYLVGKYKVLPMSLPAAWRDYLQTLIAEYQAEAKERGLLP